MNNTQLINLTRDLFNVSIKIYLQTVPGKWYESKYELNTEPIELDSIYGVVVDNSGSIDFDFRTGKREDNILKSFINQFIVKYECKQMKIIDGEFCKQTKKEVIAKLKNSDRVSKYLFYTTLYGIGYFCIFMGQKNFNNTNNILAKYLQSKNIPFTNEFSEANWVYRFVINQDVKTHNKLLQNLEI